MPKNVYSTYCIDTFTRYFEVPLLNLNILKVLDSYFLVFSEKDKKILPLHLELIRNMLVYKIKDNTHLKSILSNKFSKRYVSFLPEHSICFKLNNINELKTLAGILKVLSI